jgi:hypothetical protein
MNSDIITSRCEVSWQATQADKALKTALHRKLLLINKEIRLARKKANVSEYKKLIELKKPVDKAYSQITLSLSKDNHLSRTAYDQLLNLYRSS